MERHADFIERLWKLRCNLVSHPSLALWIQSTLFIDLCPKRMVHKWKLHIYFYMCSRQCSFLGKRTLFLWSSQWILISKDLVTNVGVKTFLFLYLSSWMMVYGWFVLNKSIRQLISHQFLNSFNKYFFVSPMCQALFYMLGRQAPKQKRPSIPVLRGVTNI